MQTENALLGCIILSPDIMDNLSSSLKPDDFEFQDNRDLYEVISSMYSKGEDIDLITITNKIKTHKLNIPVSYVSDLSMNITASSNYEYYLKLVKEQSGKRKLEAIGSLLKLQALSPDTTTEKMIRDAEDLLSRINLTKNTVEHNTVELVKEVISNIEALRDSDKKFNGLLTGFEKLDEKLYGLHDTDLIILAARPSVGKSSLALQLARNVSLYERAPVLFFSLEMGASQLMERLLSLESKVDLTSIKTKVSDTQLQAISSSGELISGMPIFFNDKPAITLSEIRASIKAHNAKGNKIKLVIIDYLQLIGTTNSNPVAAITEISKGLKVIAKEFGIPVIALSQLSRDVEKRGSKPRLSDLRDSGSIEQDADIVLFLHRETIDRNNFGGQTVSLLISKHRNGQLGEIKFNFDGSRTQFVELDDSLDIFDFSKTVDN